MEEKLLEAAQQIEQKLADMAKTREIDATAMAKLQDDMKKLGEEQAAIGRKLLSIQQSGVNKGEAKKRVTLGAELVASTGYADLMAGRTRKVTLAAESPVTTPAGSVSEHNIGIRAEPQLPNVASAAFAHVPTSSNSISYLKEKAFTNSAAETAEATLKGESKMEFEEADSPVRTIAHFIRVTKQLAEDAPALAAYIDARMMYGLQRRIEKQIISGDGSGQNLKGIFVEGNYTAHGFTTSNMPEGSNVLDLIRRCGASMRKLGYAPNALFLSPMDFDTLRGMKDANGQYLMGTPLQAGTDIRPWGLTVIESPEVAEGKFMVADTNMGATIYDRSAPVLEMFEQDSDNVQKNLLTVRVECRMAFVVESANCFIGGDLQIGA